MALWGLLAQGIQDTIGWIGGLATGTTPQQQAQHQMSTADRDIANQERMLEHQMFVDQRNYEHTREAYEYQKQLQQQMFQREDNAVQRRTADLRAAGINPILAAGQAAGAGSPIGVTAPHQAVTGKATSMSPKLQALAMQQEMHNQRKARSLQFSAMMQQLELLKAETDHKKAQTQEVKAHAGEISERTLGYAGQRELTTSQIAHNTASTKHFTNLAEHLSTQDAHTRRQTRHYDAIERHLSAQATHMGFQNKGIEANMKYVLANAEKIKLDRDIDNYNFKLAKELGLRSDINAGLVGQLQQLLHFMTENINNGSISRTANEFLDSFEDILRFIDIPNNILDRLFPDNRINIPTAFSILRGILEGAGRRMNIQPGLDRFNESVR